MQGESLHLVIGLLFLRASQTQTRMKNGLYMPETFVGRNLRNFLLQQVGRQWRLSCTDQCFLAVKHFGSLQDTSTSRGVVKTE